jgi:hypothetical protein
MNPTGGDRRGSLRHNMAHRWDTAAKESSPPPCRLIARRDGAGACSLAGARVCLIEGEVIICGEDGIPVFDRLRYGRQPKTEAVLFAFDLLELSGKDLRQTPLEERKRALEKLLRKAGWALQLNEHIAESGELCDVP